MRTTVMIAAVATGFLALAVGAQAQGRDRHGPPGPQNAPQGGPQFNAPMPMPPPWVRGQNVPPPMAMRMRMMMQSRGPQAPMPRWGMQQGMQGPGQGWQGRGNRGPGPAAQAFGRRAMPQRAPYGRWAQPQGGRFMQRQPGMGGACECPRCHMRFGAPAMQRGPRAGLDPRMAERMRERIREHSAEFGRHRQPNPDRAARAQAPDRQGKASCPGCSAGKGGMCGKQGGSCGKGKDDRPAAGGCPMAGSCGKNAAGGKAAPQAMAGGCGSCGQGKVKEAAAEPKRAKPAAKLEPKARKEKKAPKGV